MSTFHLRPEWYEAYRRYEAEEAGAAEGFQRELETLAAAANRSPAEGLRLYGNRKARRAAAAERGRRS